MSDSDDSYADEPLHPHKRNLENDEDHVNSPAVDGLPNDWLDDIPVADNVADFFEDEEECEENYPISPIASEGGNYVNEDALSSPSPLTQATENFCDEAETVVFKAEPLAVTQASFIVDEAVTVASPPPATPSSPPPATPSSPPPPTPSSPAVPSMSNLLMAKKEPIVEDNSPMKAVSTTMLTYLDNEEDGSDFEGYEQAPEDNVDMEGIMTNIFGESDDNEEFEGFAETELGATDTAASGKNKKLMKKSERKSASSDLASGKVDSSSSSDDEGDNVNAAGDVGDGFTNDFDRLMERSREAQRSRKRRHDTSYISDVDDTIADIVRRMREVAEEDRELVKMRQPAVKKVKMLPVVSDLLVKAYLRPAMIEAGILRSIMDWLSPLPDHSLPSLSVREELVKALLDFPPLDTETLKESGVGKAIMYLRRHPNETTHIKSMCCRLIDQWSRVIFAQNTDFKSLSREERIRRDKEHLEKRRRTQPEVHNRRDLSRDLDSEERPLRPGEAGFIMRARVPQPSNRDYLIRPEWKVKTPLVDARHGDEEPEGTLKTKRFDRYFRGLKQTKRSKPGTAGFSLEGRKMAL